jgi:hypothetical protein
LHYGVCSWLNSWEEDFFPQYKHVKIVSVAQCGIDLIHIAAILNPERGWRCTGCLRCTELHVRLRRKTSTHKQIKTRIDIFVTVMSTGDKWSQNLNCFPLYNKTSSINGGMNGNFPRAYRLCTWHCKYAVSIKYFNCSFTFLFLH